MLCTGLGLGQGPGAEQGTGLAQQETMGSGPCPCLGPVWTFLHNILEPINLSPVPCSIPGPGRMQCEYTISRTATEIACSCNF